MGQELSKKEEAATSILLKWDYQLNNIHQLYPLHKHNKRARQIKNETTTPKHDVEHKSTILVFIFDKYEAPIIYSGDSSHWMAYSIRIDGNALFYLCYA